MDNRLAKVILVVREDQLDSFLRLGFQGADSSVYPWAIWGNNRIVAKEEYIEPGFQYHYLQGKGLVFLGQSTSPSILNLRIPEDFLLASDGQVSLSCPAHAGIPCIPFVFGSDNITAQDLQIAAQFVRFRELVEMRLRQAKSVAA